MRKRLKSFVYAFRGIRRMLATEPNARIHLAVTAAVLALGIWLGVDAAAWAVLALAIGLVLAAEAVNSAFEALADRLAPDPHPLVEAAKDMAAGAVLLAAMGAAAAGLATLGPPLLRRLGL